MGNGKRTNNNIKNWAAALEEEYVNRGNQPEGDGWMTFNEMEENMDGGTVKCRKIVKEAIARGELEVFTGSQKSSSTGFLCRQVWYRPKS